MLHISRQFVSCVQEKSLVILRLIDPVLLGKALSCCWLAMKSLQKHWSTANSEWVGMVHTISVAYADLSTSQATQILAQSFVISK